MNLDNILCYYVSKSEFDLSLGHVLELFKIVMGRLDILQGNQDVMHRTDKALFKICQDMQRELEGKMLERLPDSGTVH